MPKLKTNKAVKKRIKITKNGKILGSKSNRRHLMTNRSAKSKRQARGWKNLSQAKAHDFKRAIPYN